MPFSVIILALGHDNDFPKGGIDDPFIWHLLDGGKNLLFGGFNQMVGDCEEEIVCSPKILINLSVALEVWEVGFNLDGNSDNAIVFPSLIRKEHQDSIVPKTNSCVLFSRRNIFPDLVHSLKINAVALWFPSVDSVYKLLRESS